MEGFIQERMGSQLWRKSGSDFTESELATSIIKNLILVHVLLALLFFYLEISWRC